MDSTNEKIRLAVHSMAIEIALMEALNGILKTCDEENGSDARARAIVQRAVLVALTTCLVKLSRDDGPLRVAAIRYMTEANSVLLNDLEGVKPKPEDGERPTPEDKAKPKPGDAPKPKPEPKATRVLMEAVAGAIANLLRGKGAPIDDVTAIELQAYRATGEKRERVEMEDWMLEAMHSAMHRFMGSTKVDTSKLRTVVLHIHEAGMLQFDFLDGENACLEVVRMERGDYGSATRDAPLH